MKAVYCVKHGSFEDLEVREVAPPGRPAADEIQIEIACRPIHFGNLVQFEGKYQIQKELPFVVGGPEAAGTIVELGPEVHDFSVGDKVLAVGGCIERTNVPSRVARPVPDGVDLKVASSFLSSYHTALYGLRRAQLQPGETLLVHGAAGGVGLAAVDIGKLMGATVIGTASTDEKLAEVAKMGADHVINYSDGFREQVKDLTSGLGADVIFDPVGGDVFDESMRSIAPFGRILIVGFAGGRAALAKTNRVLVKEVSLIGFTLTPMQKYKPEMAEEQIQVLMGWLACGRIHPRVSHVIDMENVVEAYRLIAERKVIGTVVLTS